MVLEKVFINSALGFYLYRGCGYKYLSSNKQTAILAVSSTRFSLIAGGASVVRRHVLEGKESIAPRTNFRRSLIVYASAKTLHLL